MGVTGWLDPSGKLPRHLGVRVACGGVCPPSHCPAQLALFLSAYYWKLQASQFSGILTIKLGPTDIISKMNFFQREGQVPINMLSVWIFNIKFVLLFGKIPTNCYFYFRNNFIIESYLSKSYVKEKA